MSDLITLSAEEGGAASAGLPADMLPLLLFLVPILLFALIVGWRFYARGGCRGWACLIPIYNVYCLFKIAYGSGWMMLLLLVPGVNVIIGLLTPFFIAHAYNKGFWFGLGFLLFPALYPAIIAFGDLYYCGPNL